MTTKIGVWRSLLFCVIALVQVTLSANVTLDWNVTYVENVNLDGKYPRRAIGINGEYPPPIINVNQSDVLVINMFNGLTNNVPTSLHGHGMFFNNTNYWDGAVGVTQCPVPAGQSVDYQPLNSINSPQEREAQWGTFWTHSHYGGQYVDGLRTPSIIHAEKEVYEYDDDFTIILADWYHDEYPDLVSSEFLNVKNPTGAEPVPDSGLIYIAHTSQFAPATYLPGFNENATLSFEAGKTYRIRLINMAALSMIHFWMEGHQMSIIEADGVDMHSMPVDALTLSVAQRYSILVTARNDTSQNWLMHANLDPDMFDQVPPELNLNLTSTISYKEGNPLGSDQPFIDYTYFDDTTLEPILVEPQLEATVTNSVIADFTTYKNGKNYAMFNDTTYVQALTPSMFTMVSMPENQSSLIEVYGANGNAIVVDHLQIFQLKIINADTGHHPFHLHGHHFQLVHKAQDYTSDDPELNPPFLTNQSNPSRRDTVVIPGGGSVTIQFITDNPGAWFLHCHIAWHLTSGLAIQIIEAPVQFRERVQIPSYLNQQCTDLGFSPSGNAGGLQSLTDFGALPAGPTHLESGWTSKAVGTFVACLLTALLGVGTVAWYGFSSNKQDEDDDDDDE